eukprot:426108_1
MEAETETEEFKEDTSYATILKNADITRSLPKALFSNPNKVPTEQSSDVNKVLKFIENNINNTDDTALCELIEANLKYMALNLNQYTIRIYQNAEKVEVPYHIQQRRILESQWIKCGIGLHKLMCIIINASINRPNNPYTFYSLYILKGLCLGQCKETIAMIINETDIMNIIFGILNSDANSNNINKTWLEQIMCTELIECFECFVDKSIWNKYYETQNMNILKLLIKISVNCFIKFPYFYNTMNEYHKKIILLTKHIDPQNTSQLKSQDDIPTYLRSPYADKNPLRKCLHYWLYRCRIRTLHTLKLFFLHNYSNIQILINNINNIHIKRLLQISTMTMRQGKQTYPPQVNSIDIVVLLSQNKHISEIIVSDNEIMTNLIICIRSRGSVSEFNNANLLVLIYFITVQHELMPRYYFNDVIYALMDTIESEWKNISLLQFFGLPSTNELIIQTLKYLFGVPKFTIIDKEEYLCVICQNIYNNPHTFSCGHSMCYTCLTNLIATKHTNYEVYFTNTIATYHCPLCRKEFKGQFDRDDKKSSFTLNYQLQNKMYSSQIVVDSTCHQEFKGTEYDFWCDLKLNHIDQLYDFKMAKCENIKMEFITFCEFMEKNSKIYTGNIKTERKQNVLKARDIKGKGNILFKDKKYKEAILKYKAALTICPLFHDDRTTYLSNIALCYIKLKDYINAFRTTQKGLMIHNSHIKLLNNSLLSLSNLLFEGIERDKLNNYIHDKISVCGSNYTCMNRRCYDIILSQLAWEAEFHYCLKKIRNGNDNQRYADNLRKTDTFIQNIRNIDTKIEQYLPINFEEYQFLKFIGVKNKVKRKMHDFIVEKLYGKTNVNLDGINTVYSTIDLIDDLLITFDDEVKMLTINELIEMMQLHWMEKPWYKFYSKYFESNIVKFIVSKSNMLKLVDDESNVVKLVANYKQHKEQYNAIEDKEGLFNNWNDNNEDFITAKLYAWERCTVQNSFSCSH